MSDINRFLYDYIIRKNKNKMTQVKIFESTDRNSLERSINKFITDSSSGIMIKDIKYKIYVFPRNTDIMVYSALLMFDQNQNV